MNNNKANTIKTVAWFVVTILIVVIMIGVGIAYSVNETTYTITVTDKERITEKSGDSVSSKYLVFGDDENGNSLVFQNIE